MSDAAENEFVAGFEGKPVTLPIMGVFEIEGGRIKAWREYFDLGPVRAAYDGG
jgi:limonene-1,2-epoxide hydrolase